MSERKYICPVCGHEEVKTGKLKGVASVFSMQSKSGFGGSEVYITFCAKCGEVLSMKVAEPYKIK